MGKFHLPPSTLLDVMLINVIGGAQCPPPPGWNRVKNIIFNVIYRPLDGDIKSFESYLFNFLTSINKAHKNIVLIGDFNLNLLDFNKSKIVQSYVDIMFQFGLISLINCPSRVVKNSFSARDHIMTDLIDKKCETGIIKTDLSDHFPILVNFDLKEPTPNKKTENDFFYKRSFDKTSINKFKMRLKEVNWTILDSLENPCEAFDRFMEIIRNLYEESFPNKKVKTKHKKTSKGIRYLILSSLCFQPRATFLVLLLMNYKVSLHFLVIRDFLFFHMFQRVHFILSGIQPIFQIVHLICLCPQS